MVKGKFLYSTEEVYFSKSICRILFFSYLRLSYLYIIEGFFLIAFKLIFLVNFFGYT